jgi:ubiquinone/menaquinone biosynthesis C-methylase UbiE
MTEPADTDTQRAEMRERWDQAAPGWGRRAEHTREMGMPMSTWMIEQLSLQPGQRLLELAAGPGDTGFLAAELIEPGGTLICSDASEGMLEVARERARKFGVESVEFRQLELEWIDLPAASVDALLCRWGFMLCLDPAAAMHESRRVLSPGGRIALAVWDVPQENPWATIVTRALMDEGYGSAPDPNAPGMFALAEPGKLQGMLEDAGFLEVLVDSVEIRRLYESFDEFWGETLDLSRMIVEALEPLSEDQRTVVKDRVRSLAKRFRDGDGRLVLPGRSLAASASA